MCLLQAVFRIVSRIELWNYVDSISLQSLFYLHICVLQQAICSELCHILTIELWNYVGSISLQSLFYLHICVLQAAICSELCHVLSYGIMLVPSLSNLYSIHIFGILFQWF